MAYNSSANILVTNNFAGTANITLSHAYSDDPPVQRTWNNVAVGAAGTPPLVAGFNLGFLRTGGDWWQVTVDVLDGAEAGQWQSDSHECMLRSADNGKTLTFSVSSDAFVMTEISGTCSTGMSKQS